MTEITTIIADVGGVLVLTHDINGRRKWEDKLGLMKGQLSKEVYEMQPGELATTGDVDSEDIWESIQKKFSLTDEQLAEMETDFYAGDIINDELFHFLEAIKTHYTIVLLSNAWGNARKIYTEKYHLDTISKDIIISAEEGIRKPQPEIYKKTLEKLHITDPSTVLFIDDAKENIEAAQHLGINGIIFEDTKQTIEEMKQLYNIGKE